MKILVTGAKGQLGSELFRLSEKNSHQFIFVDIDDLDLTDFSAVDEFLQKEKPEVIINCAAYTAVDKSEQEPETALKLNRDIPEKLAEYCLDNNARLFHISTDYVFNGKNFKPYIEDDKTDPQGAYAFSKSEGEKKVLEVNPDGFIIRTSWLYSAYGNNFLKTIYNKIKKGDPLRVVGDQIGTPTWAHDLAESILELLQKEMHEGTEILHYSNEGVCSWFDFAMEIASVSGIRASISAIETKDYPTPAQRPFYSVLNKTKIKEKYGIRIPYWKDSVVRCLNDIREKENF